MKMRNWLLGGVVLLSAGWMVNVYAAGAGVYTLYRSSVLDASARLHVASFDADDGDAYNRENCQAAADLFGGQAGVKTRFWCEKGRYRK